MPESKASTLTSAVTTALVDASTTQTAGLPSLEVSACQGRITADTARELGIREIIEAEPHTVPGLVESLARRFG